MNEDLLLVMNGCLIRMYVQYFCYRDTKFYIVIC